MGRVVQRWTCASSKMFGSVGTWCNTVVLLHEKVNHVRIHIIYIEGTKKYINHAVDIEFYLIKVVGRMYNKVAADK